MIIKNSCFLRSKCWYLFVICRKTKKNDLIFSSIGAFSRANVSHYPNNTSQSFVTGLSILFLSFEFAIIKVVCTEHLGVASMGILLPISAMPVMILNFVWFVNYLLFQHESEYSHFLIRKIIDFLIF